MSERETHNVMSVSVDSFSQLPFIRPAPARNKAPSSSPAIRLFGFDFPPEPSSPQEEPSKDAPTSTDDTSNSNPNGTTTANTGVGESGRKFECHYCCRNFPTSQALGGHQNAHKRERQHAKRAQLQSAITAHHHHHHHQPPPGFIGDSHLYGLLSYPRLGSVPSAARFEPLPPPHYPAWARAGPTMNPTSRFSSGLGSLSQPINGSPLPGIWKVPVHGGALSLGMIHRDCSTALPLLGEDDSRAVRVVGEGGSIGSSSSSSSTSPRDQGGYYRSSAKDGLSLDLHL